MRTLLVGKRRWFSLAGTTKKFAAGTSRGPLAETSLILAPSAIKAGPRLDALTKCAGPVPKMAWY